MVRVVLSLILIVLFAGQAIAEQNRKLINGDDLRNMLRNSEQNHRQREQELKTDEMHELYRVKSRQRNARTDSSDMEDPDQLGPGSGVDKESGSGEGGTGTQTDGTTEMTHSTPGEDEGEGMDTDKAGDQGDASGPKTAGKVDGRKDKKRGRAGSAGADRYVGPLGAKDRYIPPSWKVLQGGGGFVTDQAKTRGPEFGISMGTRIYGEIRRVVTNVERNRCEVYVTQDVVGDRRTMAAGTVLFCNKGLNEGTKRLELSAVQGITPEKTEFSINAYVMDTSEMAGLTGAITSDEKTLKRSIGKGAYEVGRSVVSALNDGSVIGAGVEAATENALDESETETDKVLGQPQYIITVPPQKVILRVEKTF